MPDLGIGQDKEKALIAKMSYWGIKESDIIENFIRSQGPGGQNVNKTSTCVYLKHIPTGIEVKCQQERSQAMNRYVARQILIKKIEAGRLKKAAEEKKRIEKLRRQKRKRSQKAKLKILEGKRRHAGKKSLRAKIHQIEKD